MARRTSKILCVERHQGVGLAIDRRLQYHLVAGISELRPPQKVHCDWLGQRDNRIYKNIHLIFAEACREPMLGSAAN